MGKRRGESASDRALIDVRLLGDPLLAQLLGRGVVKSQS